MYVCMFKLFHFYGTEANCMISVQQKSLKERQDYTTFINTRKYFIQLLVLSGQSETPSH